MRIGEVSPFRARIPTNSLTRVTRLGRSDANQLFRGTMKRARKDQLTGGSADVNPQVLTLTITMSAANTPTVVARNLPIPRLPTREGRNLVIELLSVEYFRVAEQVTNGADNISLAILTTNPSAFASFALALQDPRVLSAAFTGIYAAAATTIDYHKYFYDDLTDQAGHGILLASDTLYFAAYSSGKAIADAYVCKVNYRWKDVSLVEYIGIVQSEQ